MGLGMMPIMIRMLPICIACVVALAGCNLAKASLPDAAGASRVRLQANPMSATATLGALTRSLREMGTEPRATAAPASQCADDKDDRPARRVNADVRIDYQSRSAEVDQTIAFSNREALPLEALVLDAQANQWEDSFWLLDLRVNDARADYDLSLNRLEIGLDEPLAPGCQLEIGLKFRLQPAEIRDGLRSYRGFYGYSPRQLNLGHFLPTVAARLDGGWRIHEPIGIGEQVVYEVADWRVTVSVDNAGESLTLAAPGAVRELEPLTWEVELLNSRDFAISLSDDIIVNELQLANDATVQVYSFADARINANGIRLDGGDHILKEAEKALDLYGRIFGPFDRERFVIVQGDFPDGMEFTGLVFVGGAWFTNFEGGPKNYLTLISVHEIAHQWWYARVGNDSALNPWLDEALATYSEYLFIEEYYPAEKNWWWTFRVANFFPQGKVDSEVYEFATAREYINAVYLRGVQMLHNLRVDIGDEAFFALLRGYVAAGDGAIAAPTLFWSQLPPERRALTLATRGEYLSEYGDAAVFGGAESKVAAPAPTAGKEQP